MPSPSGLPPPLRPVWHHRFIRGLLILGGLILLGGWGGKEALPRGVYLSFRFALEEAAAAGLGEAFAGRPLKQVLPELGVFDPTARALTDFAGTVSVPVLESAGGSPGVKAVRTTPARLRLELGADVQVYAWLYLNRRALPGEPLELHPAGAAARAATFDPGLADHREALLQLARGLRQWGYDGLQLDLEPFPVEDVPRMLGLMQLLRASLPADFRLSLFVPRYVPDGRLNVHPGYAWREVRPFRQLAEVADQVVVPLYDFGALAGDEEAYAQRVKEQKRLLPRGAKRAVWWFALPAFRPTAQHGPAEQAALAGKGLARGRMPAGVLYFQFTGAPEDFQPGL